MSNKETVVYAGQVLAAVAVFMPALQKLIWSIADYAATAADGVSDDELKAQLATLQRLNDAFLQPLPPEPVE